MEKPPLHDTEKNCLSAEQAWHELLKADEIDSFEEAFIIGYEKDAQKTFKEGA